MTKVSKKKILSTNTKVDRKVVENYKVLRKARGGFDVKPSEYQIGRPIEESGIQHYDTQK